MVWVVIVVGSANAATIKYVLARNARHTTGLVRKIDTIVG